MRKECDLSVTHPIVRKQVQLHSTRCWAWDWILSFHQGSFAENPVALLQWNGDTAIWVRKLPLTKPKSTENVPQILAIEVLHAKKTVAQAIHAMACIDW